jgi:hypothetical protein
VNDWKPTHKTRPGVEVVAKCEPEYGTGICRIGADGHASYFRLYSGDFAALFEPIPRPKMVEIPLELARAIRADVNRAVRLEIADSDELERLIYAAEQEQAP